MNSYCSRVCTALARPRRTTYTICGISTERAGCSNALMAISHAIMVPVRPVPGEQCTVNGLQCEKKKQNLIIESNAKFVVTTHPCTRCNDLDLSRLPLLISKSSLSCTLLSLDICSGKFIFK